MKKIVSILIAAVLVAVCLTGCGTENQGNKKMSVVTTIFPEYDWVSQMLGEKKSDVDLKLLLDNGVDLHSYQPTADDIISISTCDVFVYVGGESDKWVADALKGATNKNMTVINLLDVLGESVKEEEIIEGMQAEEEEDGEDEPEYDEHVWLSLKNSVTLVEKICDALCDADAENANTYRTNADAYIEKLKNLDGEYKNAVDNAKIKTLLFADRFPFRYLTDDYGLNYYAAFVGCSAESEASFETVSFLADKVDELGLEYVITLEGNDEKIANTVVSTSKSKTAKLLNMNSMQSVTSKDVNNGVTYISIMENNLETIKTALN